MAGGRAMLGPVLIAGERCGWSGLGLAGLVVAALVSDIFDGVLARRWRCDTAGVRLFDSMADTVFYACVAVALWIGMPQVWHLNGGLLAAVLALEAGRFAMDFAKFGKPASYHSYLAKTWGLVLAAAVTASLATGHPSVLIPVALALGVACNLEGIAMSLILPVWRQDLKTLAAARRLQQELRSRKRVEERGWRTSVAGRTTTAIADATVLALCLLAAPAFAMQPGQAAYAGGTAKIALDTRGALDTSSPTALEFAYKRAGGVAAKVEMPYAQIASIEPTQETAHPLGILPMIAVALVMHQPQRYLVTIHYVDADNVAQIAVFAVAKQDQRVLVAVVNARTRNCWQASPQCRTALERR
jgi:CDP-diacylglycerol--glycerol-3-phosphate 3-phosphatidyltransferase